jgi:creatinine amidohydrolase
MTDLDQLRLLHPEEVRRTLGDGNFGGLYQRSDEDMLAIWRVAVEETRALVEGPWA